MKSLHVSIISLFFALQLYGATSMETMIGQLLMVGFHGENSSEIKPIIEAITEEKIGGVLLLGRNIKSPQQLKNLTKSLQNASKTPLFIAVDQEGGKVARLNASNGFEDFSSAQNVGQNMDLVQAKSHYLKMAQTLKEHGINYNLAPVVDIQNSSAPIIGAKERAFSAFPVSVSLYGQAFVDAHDEIGVITSLKHFPGHGSARADSHTHVTDVSLSWEFDELRPYFDMIQTNRAKSIMVAHVYLKRFDLEYPATLSNAIVNGVLRQEMGYDGMVISDDLLMKGVSQKFNLSQRLILAINAGVDMLIISEPTIEGVSTIERVNHLLQKAVERGDIKEQSIKNAYERIMALKKEL
jgi:beta-N-acetylhexosaminidase